MMALYVSSRESWGGSSKKLGYLAAASMQNLAGAATFGLFGPLGLAR